MDRYAVLQLLCQHAVAVWHLSRRLSWMSCMKQRTHTISQQLEFSRPQYASQRTRVLLFTGNWARFLNGLNFCQAIWVTKSTKINIYVWWHFPTMYKVYHFIQLKAWSPPLPHTINYTLVFWGEDGGPNKYNGILYCTPFSYLSSPQHWIVT